jgi:hypothetical protein
MMAACTRGSYTLGGVADSWTMREKTTMKKIRTRTKPIMTAIALVNTGGALPVPASFIFATRGTDADILSIYPSDERNSEIF